MSTTVTYQVASGGGDGYVDNASVNNSATSIIVGKTVSDVKREPFARFVGVAVPNNATIVSAKIQYRSNASSSATAPVTDIYFQATDNAAAAPLTVAEANAYSLTTNSVEWTLPNTSSGTWYDSPDISTIIQELVNRPGWTSGNAMMLLHKADRSATSTSRSFSSYNAGSLLAPKLVIEYNEPSGGTSVTVIAAVGEASAEALASIPHADVLVVGGIGEASAEALAANPTTALIVLGAVAEAVAEALPASPRADVLVQAEVAESTAEALPATALYNIHVTVLAATAEASAEALPAEPLAQRNITVEAAIGTATAEALAAVVRAGKKLYWVIKYL